MRKNLFIFLAFVVLANLLSFALTPAVSLASIGANINDQLAPSADVYGNDPGEDVLPQIVADVIQVVLGFLGIIFLVLIIYAGFLWMTAAGNEEKVKKAKDIMIAAVIGVAIILAAYAITYFVIGKLTEATGTD